jgi:hypothetical protein
LIESGAHVSTDTKAIKQLANYQGVVLAFESHQVLPSYDANPLTQAARFQ